MDRTFHGEPRSYQGELIRYQSDHDNYSCSHAEVAMSGCDGKGVGNISTFIFILIQG
jgi:hypothetical protein